MARVPWRPPAFKNAKSMRYNSGTLPLPIHARRLPGTMQTANMAKRGSAASSQIITQTFGVFRESLGCTRLQQRGNSRVPAPCTLRLAVVPVPIDETDALKLGVGLDLLVNPADVGSPGAFESARLCLRARRPTRPLVCPCLCVRRLAPAGLPVPLCPPVRARRLAPAGLPALPRPPACTPATRLFRLFRFPANLRHAPA